MCVIQGCVGVCGTGVCGCWGVFVVVVVGVLSVGMWVFSESGGCGWLHDTRVCECFMRKCVLDKCEHVDCYERM